MKKIFLYILLISTCLLPQGTNTTLVGQWGYGPTYALAAKNNILFLGSGSMVAAYDISNNTTPVKLGDIALPGKVRNIVVQNNTAYVAASTAGMCIVDISNPAAMSVTGTWMPGANISATGTAVVGNSVFVACGLKGYALIDVSNPADPVPVKLPFTSNDDYRSVLIEGNTLYIMRYNKGFDIYDISNPSLPLAKGSYSGSNVYDLAVKNAYVYIAKGSNGMRIMNATDPANIVESGFVNASIAQNIALNGSFAYVGCGESGMKVINISNVSAPVIAGSYANTNNASHVICINSTAVLNDIGKNIKLLDVSIPATITLKGSIRAYGSVTNIARQGNYIYAAHGTGGISIVDVSNKVKPKEVGFYDSPGFAAKLVVQGSMLYFADNNTLTLVDVSNPAAPTVTGTLNTNAAINQLAASGNYVYVANNNLGMKIINVTNPSSPVQTGVYTPPSGQQTGGVAVYGNYAYISDISGTADGVKILSILNPASPVLAGSITGEGSIMKNLKIVNDTLCYQSAGFVYYHGLSNPGSPGGGLSWSFANVNDFYHDDLFIYGASARDKLQILDRTRNFNQLPVAGYFTPGECLAINLQGNYIHVADGECGLAIIKNGLSPLAVQKSNDDRAGDFTLDQNYPNPFNPATRITYTLHKDSYITLNVYDALGRLVTTLANGFEKAGEHTVHFGGEGMGNLASGLYVYKLSSSEGIQSRKMLLVK